MNDDRIQRVQIRQPATANLMVDSEDRTIGTWGNFTINRPNSLLNGFFHRVGATEIVLEWNEPNIQGLTVNGVALSAITVVVGGTPYTVNLPTGFYTVSSAFAALVGLLTTAAIPGATWAFTLLEGLWYLDAGVAYSVVSSPLALRMGIYDTGFDGEPARIVYAPDLRPYRYIDFVSSQLTYNQRLKDASTAPMVHDVLARWYFAWDQPPSLDADGFPILMGYNPFVVRRTFSPPKQIRWESNMPIGQINFQVYNDEGALISLNDDNAFLMTLQISED